MPSRIEGVDSRWSILFGTTFCLQWGVVDFIPKVPAALTFAGMHLANELVVSVSDLPLVWTWLVHKLAKSIITGDPQTSPLLSVTVVRCMPTTTTTPTGWLFTTCIGNHCFPYSALPGSRVFSPLSFSSAVIWILWILRSCVIFSMICSEIPLILGSFGIDLIFLILLLH